MTAPTQNARYMMATAAHHKLGDISRDEPDLAYIDGEDGDDYIGAWVTGIGYFNVRFPKATTRELTDEERARYDGKTLSLGNRPVARIDLGPRPVDWDKPLEPVMGVPASGCDCSIDGGHGLAPWPDRSHPHAEDCPAYRAPDDVPPNAGSSS